MSGACRTHGKDEKMHTKVLSENLKGRDQSEDPGVDGNMILKWIIGK
jgi:hypothetical protein